MQPDSNISFKFNECYCAHAFIPRERRKEFPFSILTRAKTKYCKNVVEYCVGVGENIGRTLGRFVMKNNIVVNVRE